MFTPNPSMCCRFAQGHETWSQCIDRVSRSLGDSRTYTDFRTILTEGRFVPAGQIWRGAGDDRAVLLNCFVAPATVVYLEPLDKGLSGSTLWLARWTLSGVETKYHVFKIGDHNKLLREFRAIERVASVLDRRTPQATYYANEDAGIGLLRQEFIGDDIGEPQSLRRYIESSSSVDDVLMIIDRLHKDRLSMWHRKPDANENRPQEKMPPVAALDWWTSRMNLTLCMRCQW